MARPGRRQQTDGRKPNRTRSKYSRIRAPGKTTGTSRCADGLFDEDMDVQDGLPPCHGPKLHPSALANASITWKDMLDDYSEPYSGHSEIMAHVFKVEIESKHYALKVFMPYDISYDYHQFYTAGIRCTEEELEWHVMPFYSECRAYGRIKQAQDRRLLPHQVAVPCHGYIRLEEKDIRKLEDEWNLISVLNRTTP
ncbi:kinetochore sim4 complex subunit FTA2 domain-containing protein [Hirsutella rhossiliensis]|uniref:Kinetochore sim4 complex subunit FTA2 domain-containing protein n=1 Tax=Hirsutella rhossiliensis TaxID=111463 RepID=A0A9P8MVW7_9HYPO|nr:kinetochore sim4 complex subunit FTA2 domain-containing protein [Hirsutella rhossiliensis]KAH0962154.1 kinetochore sim4 complex subunit FTA2 domain-containing protein [Hirsutella rhossiliensis]